MSVAGGCGGARWLTSGPANGCDSTADEKSAWPPRLLRANRLTPTAALSPELKFHSLRHAYASLCVAAGIPPFDISRFMGHAKPTTTLGIYAHLFEDNHAEAMAVLGAMATQPKAKAGNVIPLRS